MKKRVTIISLIGILVLIFAFMGSIIDFIINVQWFREVGYLSVYFTKVIATLKLTVPIFFIIFISIWLYYRSIRKSIVNFPREVGKVNKIKGEKVLFLIINAVISFFISYNFASNYWYTILQFTNSTKFNISDPIFNKDISFFVFKLPLVKSLCNIGITLLIFLVIITFISYLLMNAKDKIFSRGENGKVSYINNFKSGITKFAGKQLAVVASLILLFISLAYLIKAWELVYSPRGVAFGASYTDVKVSLKLYKLIFVVSLISSIVTFISILMNKIKPIIISVVLIIVLIVCENLGSVVVQKFVVQSNEQTLEKPYIKYNIDYTRKAFNIDKIDEKPFEIKNNLTNQDITDNKEIIDNIKVNSFKPALEFYNQFQYIRFYYRFNDIDIDRYKINGKYNQVFIAPREIELDKLDNNANTWQNRHLVYTHGYGAVMSKVNSVTSEGQPDFIISNIPLENKTDIKLDNPRIYYGESTNDYCVVNTKIGELDYPKGGENQMTNYKGNAGIKMTLGNRILFALNEKNSKFLLSRDITSESKILINRNIIERTKKIAPFLIYDSDPYVVINNGRMKWIIDAYTATDRYPFSEPQNGVNYIRNSVKVVIDAADGNTDFYIVDKNDPIINSYQKIFPKLFKDLSTLDKGISEHFRYPEDLFKAQCNVLSKYHITEPGVFYNGDDVWSIAQNQEKIEGEKIQNEASYMTMKLPNEDKQEMVVTEYFNTKGRNNMVGLFGVRMDGDNYGKMILYKFPPKGTVYSPILFKQKVNQDPIISKELSLWDTKGSQVQFGETLIIPIKETLLYVEPLYIRAKAQNSIPEMKNIIVSYSDKVVLAPNIEEALKKIFNYSEVTKSEQGNTNKTTSKVPENIKIAKELYNKAVESQKNGNWSEYGDNIKKLGEILNSMSN